MNTIDQYCQTFGSVYYNSFGSDRRKWLQRVLSTNKKNPKEYWNIESADGVKKIPCLHGYIELNCNPVQMLGLGTPGWDVSSTCLNEYEGIQYEKKYDIVAHPNTFVIRLMRGGTRPQERCWGILVPKDLSNGLNQPIDVKDANIILTNWYTAFRHRPYQIRDFISDSFQWICETRIVNSILYTDMDGKLFSRLGVNKPNHGI